MEDICRIREAIAKGASVLTDQETEYIKQQAALLGENGEVAVGRVLDKARELASQPADVSRMIEGYLNVKASSETSPEKCANVSRFRYVSRDTDSLADYSASQ
jgi:hypothetical protein